MIELIKYPDITKNIDTDEAAGKRRDLSVECDHRQNREARLYQYGISGGSARRWVVCGTHMTSL
jgi:hypothetical protein